ncbi:GNAT family N-acetyltransferase [Salinirubrum litoreum]|uniref:GNAT family N-acetyltransferase n=1 Tax=Salinirubrum litoreum TaxID=1126234 RepID=A0ABD5RCS1_9EURY|nr:GNAT family N-acetyltransferase [Salinirubrum litoreum]
MTPDHPDIRPATDDDLVGVMRVLDAGLLDADAETIGRRIAETEPGSVLVADADGRVVGAVVLGERPAWVAEVFAGSVAGDDTGGRDDPDDEHVEAIAVGRSRRGQGLGTALLRAARESVVGDLTADFAASVRPFYESLDCRIETVDDPASDGRSPGCRLVARV